MNLRNCLKKIFPPYLWRKMSEGRDYLFKRGRFDYRIKRDRESCLDYTVNCSQESLRKAKKSILWDEDWKEATAATVAVLEELELLRDVQSVIDYGGAVGRISRALLEKYEMRLFLIDRSEQMRKHAFCYIPKRYFKENRVSVWSDDEFIKEHGSLAGRVDLILFIEVLQHIPEPVLEALFPVLLSCLSENGRVFVLGNKDLDVDKSGGRHRRLISDFLRQYVKVVREDVWEQFEKEGARFKFSYPRYSFLCEPRS